MSYANDYNSYMLDDYGLPSYSSRRSSYNYAFSDQIPQPSNVYPGDRGRKLSTASERSTATKTLDLPSPRDEFNRQNSTASLVSNDYIGSNSQFTKCCGKKVRNTLSAFFIIVGGSVLVLGICLVIFSNDVHHSNQTALGPLGFFFLSLGIFIILLTLSVVFLPYKSKETKPKRYRSSLPINMLSASQLPRTISSLELDQQPIPDENNLGTPKITITPESDKGKFPLTRQANLNTIEDGLKYGESSKFPRTTF